LNPVVLASQALLDQLSGRIQRAYALRHPDWRGGCSTSRVWAAAAQRLWAAHAADPARVPLDAELFVASQRIAVPFADPWSELTQPESARRYKAILRKIVRKLRRELEREVGYAERLIRNGRNIRDALRAEGRLSALGCFIVAVRAGREDLASRFTAAAAAQHSAFPLCWQATRALLPPDRYPAPAELAAPGTQSEKKPRVEKVLLSLN
jgi:hypothetical protein